jgi:hypothetical protein
VKALLFSKSFGTETFSVTPGIFVQNICNMIIAQAMALADSGRDKVS